MIEKYLENLNSDSKEIRLENLALLKKEIDSGNIKRQVSGKYVNNHIHTTYSFSPYSPTKACYMAYMSGLETAGIMDHDSISGAREFIEAGKILGIKTTVGVELRVNAKDTSLEGKRINNPDQKSIFYMAIHGVPHQNIEKVEGFFKFFREERNKRNIKMVKKVNEIFSPYGIILDFDKDVKPLSNWNIGGSITERHLLFALSKKVKEKFEKAEKIIEFLENEIGLNVSEKNRQLLMDETNKVIDYDLLGAMKSELVGKIYIDATDECPNVETAVEFAKEIGAISAYAYLGDVGDSVTGDKKTQKFEDDYIDLLFSELDRMGFDAVTYMPSRNTLDQLKNLKRLCKIHDLFEISGEDINSPRQSFICKHLEMEEFKNLIDSTYALIGHEIAASEDQKNAMFSDETIAKISDLEDRINYYKEIGKR